MQNILKKVLLVDLDLSVKRMVSTKHNKYHINLWVGFSFLFPFFKKDDCLNKNIYNIVLWCLQCI